MNVQKLLILRGRIPLGALMVLSLPALVLGHVARADEAAQAVLDEVKVNASQDKEQDAERSMAETMFLLPYSQSAVGAEEIRDENTANVTDAISDLAGVAVTSQGSFNRSLSIRGLDGPRVVTMLDGVKIGNQGMNHSGAGELNMTDVSSVEAINVVRGSPSVMFDPGASGGVVNVITEAAPTERVLGFKQTLGYDEGYGKTTSSTTVKGGTGDVGAKLIYTKDEATDYKMGGGDAQKELLISTTNATGGLSQSSLPVSDLGYNAESLSARASAKLFDDALLDVNIDRWLGKDINFIHGPSIGEAMVVHYDRMERDTQSVRLRKQRLGMLEDVSLSYANQRLVQDVGANALGTQLDSNNFALSAVLPYEALRMSVGAEAILDNAETLVASEQDYYATYLNLEYPLGDFLLNGGVRGNWWSTRQQLLEGSNATLAQSLLGISGSTPEMDVSSPTWALGAVYPLNNEQNLALNVSTTYRNSDLYERYAFGSVLGGGLDMVPEEGRNLEASWKYLDQHLAMTASVFYSEFDNFITTKTVRQLTNAQGLQNCIQAGLCNPVSGDFNGRENEFFTQYVKYYNAAHVTNQGAEFSARYDRNEHDARIALSYNDVKSDDIFVVANSQPLRMNLSYKYRFAHEWKPWLMMKLEYATDTPEVQ